MSKMYICKYMASILSQGYNQELFVKDQNITVKDQDNCGAWKNTVERAQSGDGKVVLVVTEGRERGLQKVISNTKTCNERVLNVEGAPHNYGNTKYDYAILHPGDEVHTVTKWVYPGDTICISSPGWRSERVTKWVYTG